MCRLGPPGRIRHSPDSRTPAARLYCAPTIAMDNYRLRGEHLESTKTGMNARTRQLGYGLITVATAFLCCSIPAAAQKAPAPGANIAGKVVEPSGAVIVGATVTLTAGGLRLETTSDGRGLYYFDQVPPGSYTILAFRDGFSPRTQDVVVTASQPVALDLKLEIAGFREEVTVAFTAAAALSAMKTETPIADIPLSVQSYTGSFMKAIETTNVADLYNYTTGVARSGNTAGDFLIRRLRASNTGNNQYNGLPGPAARLNSPSTRHVERRRRMKDPTSLRC